MSFKRNLAVLADRPGGRSLLAALATRAARSLTGDPDVAVVYDGMWIDVVDGASLPRSREFNYPSWHLERMKRFARERLNGSVDYWTFAYKPEQGDVIVDIGAGIGVDAISLSKLVGPSGRVYSIEAHPWTYSALQKTCRLNNLTNVRTYHMAIADAPGSIWITDLANDEGNSVSKSQGDIKVRSLDLDSFVRSNGIRKIDLLKMNIEGAEEMAIEGMKDSIKLVRHAVIACHDFRGDLGGTKKPVVDFLQANGFEVLQRPDDPRPYVRDHVHAIRKPTENPR